MTAFRALAAAQLKGFVRERQALLWVLLFPMMFLVLFGSLFADPGQHRSVLLEVGEVPLLEEMPADTRAAFDAAFQVEPASGREAAMELVRAGDAAAMVAQSGDTLVLHYSRADRVQAATVQGTLNAFVQQANLDSSGTPPRYTLRTEQVEDESLEAVQFLMPGLLGWAVATGATFGAATTLVHWRTSQLLRRLRLAPVGTGAIVGARVAVSLAVALLQTFAFLALGVGVFGVQLTGSWWMAVPLVGCGTLAFMALGLLAGAVSRTTEAASGIANLVVLPMAFLSGSFIPLDVAPDWMRTVASVLPLGHLNEGMLDVMVRGQDALAAVPPMMLLLGFAAVVGWLATRLFRWEDV